MFSTSLSRHCIFCFNFHGFNSRPHNASCFCSAGLKDQKSILDGKCIQEKSCRRSPRLTSTHSECKRICSSTTPSQEISASPAKDNLGVALSNNHNRHSDAKPGLLSFHKETKPIKQSHAKFSGEKPLRQSPRLNPSTGDHASEACVHQLDVKMSSGMKLRRSPRFSSGSENLEVISFQEKRNSKVVHQKKKNTKVISTSIELSNSDSPLEQNSKVKTISRISTRIDDINCLRWSSEAIASPVENGRTSSDSFALLQFDDNLPRTKYKKSASVTKERMNKNSIPSFIGDPIPDDEAQKRWGWRYELKVIDLIFFFNMLFMLSEFQYAVAI